jgi:hypothetical protein
MAPGVTTHGAEMQARYVQLAVTHRDSTGLDAVAPPSAGVAPPGWYMLFLLNSKGVPSVARWVHVDVPPAGTKPPPGPPRFGASTRVSVVGAELRLHHDAVTVRVANANGFGVPTDARLQLKGKAAQNTAAATATWVLPARSSRSLVIRLGSRRASLVRRHGHLHAVVSLLVRDPRGNRRTVRRTVDVLATQP